MKTSIRNSWISLTAFAASLFIGCQQADLFDVVQTKKMYEDIFPVKNVAGDMDWKTTSKASVSISVEEDYNVVYTVQLFDANPLISSENAKLLSSGIAKTNLKFETEIDYPTALNTVFVCRVDESGRRIVKPVVIDNGMIETSFVGDASIVAKSSKSMAEMQAVNSNMTPYTDTEINTMLAVAHAFKTGKEALDDLSSYPNNYQNNTISIIKLTGDYTGSLTTSNSSLTYGAVRLIISGHCTLTGGPTINGGVEIIVANGGTLTINNQTLSFSKNSSLSIMQGGTVKGSPVSSIHFLGEQTIHNGGTIQISSLTTDGVCHIYNLEKATMNIGGSIICGTSSITNYGLLSANTIAGTFSDGTTHITNYGTLSANRIEGYGTLLDNACKLVVSGYLQTSELRNRQSAYLECNLFKVNWHGIITMEANSIFNIKTSAALWGANITGPTEEWALLKIKSISDAGVIQSNIKINSQLTEGYIINNIYCEYDDMRIGGDKTKPTTGYDWLLVMINGNGNLNRTLVQNTNLVGNGHTAIAKFGEAPLFIPSGDCTLGNTPTDYVPPVVVSPITYTYAFEDMFPTMGDYDFNDVVMDVKWDQIRNSSNAITGITYHVTLAAVGATKELGAGLRLYDVNKSIISSITYGGDATSFRSTLTGVMFYPVENNLFEGNNTDAVIPLFDDAQKVLTGTANRALMLNTGNNKVPNADTKTLDITITFNAPQATVPIAKENLDFFIAFNSGKQVPTTRNEIHLYEFRDRQSPVGIDNSRYITVAANYPWAISVPEFRYPIERTSIISAYDGFASWAQAPKEERQQYEGWYKTVTSDQKVFR